MNDSVIRHVLDRVRYALDEARRTISVDHPVRLHVESAMADIDFFVAMLEEPPSIDAVDPSAEVLERGPRADRTSSPSSRAPRPEGIS